VRFAIIARVLNLRIRVPVLLGVAVVILSSGAAANASAAVWQVNRFTTVPGAIFTSLSAVGEREVWAVGSRTSASGETVVAAAHRTASGWHAVRAVQPGTGGRTLCCSFFTSVDALSSTDVWAVGAYFTNAHRHALIEHYDGMSWTKIAQPHDPQGGDRLFAVSADSPTDVWAVGSDFAGDLVEHYDGTSWSIIPAVSQLYDGFTAVAAVSPSDVWAGGYSGLIEHWDGSSWTNVSPAAFAKHIVNQMAVVPGTNNVWMSTTDSTDSAGKVGFYNGSSWTVSPIQQPLDSYDLAGIAVDNASDVWLLGQLTRRGPATTIAEHWNGSHWVKMKTAMTAGSYGVITSAPGSIRFYAYGRNRLGKQMIARYS
jgi:hypothetical protein